MKKFLRIVLVLAILVGLWFLARYAAGTGPARRHFADNLVETLGADKVEVASTTLEFPFTFVARDVRATIAAPEVTVFAAPEIRVGCCAWRIDSPTVLATAKPDGSIVPVFFSPDPVRKALDGSGRPCPVTMLSTVSDAWEVGSEWFHIRKAEVGYRDLDGAVHPVFTGLTWTKSPVRLGKHGRVDYSAAKWTTFGPAVAPDGRPNDGRPGEAEWLGGRGTPVQPLWAPKPPCPGMDAATAPPSPEPPREEPPAPAAEPEPPAPAPAPAPAPVLPAPAPQLPPPAPAPEAPAPAPVPEPSAPAPEA